MSPRSLRARSAAALIAVALVGVLAACTSPDEPPAKIATATDAVTHDENDRVVEGARWTQHYFPSSDGSKTELHADVLLPEDLPKGERVPVILSVSSYFGHTGERLDEGHDHAGPAARFYDLVRGGDLMERGYGLVMVDLRGFGGSSGCLDYMGPGEQADVKAAIDWSAAQSWSTGDVGMYGKSYDAITGLVGNNLGQRALKAVVAQEPIWDLVTGSRSNGVPRAAIVDRSRSYNEAATLPPLADDDARYRTNATYEKRHPECTILNSFENRTADPRTPYWTDRDLAARAKGTDTPILLTQGWTENVTPPESFEEFLVNHEGPERGWLGPWNHIRGNETVGTSEKPAMGRRGWFAEVMSFFDQHLKGIEPTTEYPDFAVQDNTGSWRAQETWPVVDAVADIPLAAGSYLDDGAEGDPAVETGNSYAQLSGPVAQPIRITGTPRVSMQIQGTGNVLVRLYDVAPDGTAVLFDEHAGVVTPGTTAFELKSTDWTLAAGHRLAVDIGTIESNSFSDWIDTPSQQVLRVTDASMKLALDDPADDEKTSGGRAAFLATYVAASTRPSVVGEATFQLPRP